MESILKSINMELEQYMESFFSNSNYPISMRLEAFKEKKDGDIKAAIDIRLERNGEEIPLDILSGGEYDRCALALFLSFNKISKSSIIILDECLSSLHSELVEDIIDEIRKRNENKLILFTLHQANTGLFDSTINVELLN